MAFDSDKRGTPRPETLGDENSRAAFAVGGSQSPAVRQMNSKAEQYRRYGEQASASANEAACKIERAELLKIAETWLELARNAQHAEAGSRHKGGYPN